MNKQIINVLTKTGLLGAVLLFSAVTSTRAQSLEYRIKATIPFDFNVADKKMQAGEYSVIRTNQNAGDGILSISNLDGQSRSISAVVPVESWKTSSKARLVFHRYGDQYFLFQVWPPSAMTGRQFIKSRTERDLNQVSKNSHGSGPDNKVEIVTIMGIVE
ncbi:MAG TPA: hypothetical protein VFD63_01030 [Pyrinomonadaceae bacterium]|nr:hypothetical protein [Pyrinomonadaceae bacterium]